MLRIIIKNIPKYTVSLKYPIKSLKIYYQNSKVIFVLYSREFLNNNKIPKMHKKKVFIYEVYYLCKRKATTFWKFLKNFLKVKFYVSIFCWKFKMLEGLNNFHLVNISEGKTKNRTEALFLKIISLNFQFLSTQNIIMKKSRWWVLKT